MSTAIAPRDYRILVVDDDARDRDSLARLLRNVGYKVSTADSADKALGYLEESIDCVLTDLQMGDLSGLELLKHWKQRAHGTSFLMITGHGSTQAAIEAIKAGAYHYMAKPIDVDALLIMLDNMLRHRESARKVEVLQDRLGENPSMANIVGNSPEMARIFELIRRSAQAFSTVLILGESGTGKDLVAEAIHQMSPRHNGPFIAVNCAAMPHGLVESELFGHEKGAFTGAADRRMGLFEAAHGGTLFIDEIGDFDISLQVKLLRAMETRTITPVGGGREIKVDTRILAATSRNIEEMMASGLFRKDLYYRLNVIMIELPPLRERIGDIPLLIKRFMERVNKQNGTHITAVSPEAINALQRYHWPGNVRELLNIVERMSVLCSRDVIGVEDLPACIGAPHSTALGVASANPARPSQLIRHARVDPALGPNKESAEFAAVFEQLFSRMTLEELEMAAIAMAMRRCHHNRTHAARALGISTRTLQRKLRVPQDGDLPAPGSEDESTIAPAKGNNVFATA